MAIEDTHTGDREDGTAAYRVTIDRNACDGIFACLTRDPRFVEGEDGLATIDPAADPAPPSDLRPDEDRDPADRSPPPGSDDGRIREDGEMVIAAFADGRIEEARKAAAACPPNAITVERVARTSEEGK